MRFDTGIPLKQLCSSNVTIIGNESVLITGLGHLGDLVDGMLSFAESADMLERLLKHKCNGVFVRRNDLSPEAGLAYRNVSFCLTPAPSHAFNAVLEGRSGNTEPDKMFSQVTTIGCQRAFISTNAFVGEDVAIGENTRVYPMAYIGNRVQIGTDCSILPNAVVLDGCKLGNGVFIGPGVTIGSIPNWYYVHEERRRDHSAVGCVVIEDYVTIGATSTVDCGLTGTTYIGRCTTIGNLVHIGHEARIGKHCVIIAQSGISGNVSIGDDCEIEAQSGVGAYVRLPNNTTVYPRAGVTRSVKRSGVVLAGFPAVEKSLYDRREMLWKRGPRTSQEDVVSLWNVSYSEDNPKALLCMCLERGWTTDLKRLVITNIREQFSIVDDIDAEPSTSISTLGGDSLDSVELIMACEEEFGVTLPDSWNEKTTLLDCIQDIARARLRPVIGKMRVPNKMKSNFLNIMRCIPGAEKSTKDATFALREDGGLDEYGMAVLAAQLEASCEVQINLQEFLNVGNVQAAYAYLLRCQRK